VPLASVQDPELVPSAIAQALAIATTGSRRPIEALLDYLRDKRTLLVLDNFEQLLPAAPVTTTLLEASPELRVLVSSRAVLRVYGEQEFPVPPLALPDLNALPDLATLSQFEAVRLFIERAVAVKPDFTATNENAPAIAGIGERVDGLPLAIELAAARVKLFSPQALLGRLEKSLSALGSGARDLPGRQQTLRGAIQWSYDLLDEGERRLLARFSVFARGASLEQVEAVGGPAEDLGGDVIEALDQLADQSLLRRLPDFDEPRFLMLQTIREFAANRLEQTGEGAAIKDRHLEAFIAVAERAQPHMFGGRRKEWLDRLEMEHDNFRAALDWAIASGNARSALQLSAWLWRFWQMRGHIHEGRARVGQALALPQGSQHPAERLLALEAAGGLAYWQADMDSAQRFYDECLEMTRKTGDKRALANALYNAAFPNVVNMRETTRPRALLQEALPLFRELGDQASVARTLWGLGNGHYFERNYPLAREVLEEAQAISRSVDDRFNLGWALHTHGLASLKADDIESARKDFLEAVQLFIEAKDVSGMVLQLDNLSQIVRRDGDPVRATRLAAAAKAHQQATGTSLGQLLSEQEGRTGREGLSQQDAAKIWAEGQALPLERALEEAVAAARRAPTSNATPDG
jgi:predicted ATPase